MAEKSFDHFSGKILLFGEYSVLLNSMGLSMPHPHCKAKLSLHANSLTDEVKQSRADMKKLLDYLFAHSDEIRSIVNIDDFARDVSKGLYFDSDIPVSYGLGSSGALCAAIYQAYKQTAIADVEDINQLRNHLAALEAGFHGKSSGLDPLSSYLGSALFIQEQANIQRVDLSFNGFGDEDCVFLVDSRQKGNTAPLVQSFLKKIELPEFRTLVEKQLIPLNNSCIHSLLQEDLDVFFRAIAGLSFFQLQHFRDKIPTALLPLWQHGSDSDLFHLKLCGSGGGGYLLGFSRFAAETQQYLHKNNYSFEILNV